MYRMSIVKRRGSTPQRVVAKHLGITTSYYGMIECGVREPSLKLAKKLADYFETTIDALFFDHT